MLPENVAENCPEHDLTSNRYATSSVLARNEPPEPAVSLANRRLRLSIPSGSVVQQDAADHLAVIQVNVPADQLVPLELGDSAGMMPGQTVVAIGNPFGLVRSMTTGIVSAVGRAPRTCGACCPTRRPPTVSTCSQRGVWPTG